MKFMMMLLQGGLLLALAWLPAGASSVPPATGGSDSAAPLALLVEGAFGRPAERSPGSIGLRSDGVTQARNQVFSGIPVEASDPRLRGIASVVSSSDSHSNPDGGSLEVFVESYEIVNADGGWSGMLTGFTLPGGSVSAPSSLIVRGAGAYDGLSAVLLIDFDGAIGPGGGFPFEGAIFIGEPPPAPVAPSSE